MAITLTPYEINRLWMQMCPRSSTRYAIDCNNCPPKAYMACRSLADEIFTWRLNKRRVKQACQKWREFTDEACDTYDCPNCPNYSWCTTLRGIAIEGVKIDEG